MNTDKLTNAIRILVREELKKQLPGILKEVTKREISKQRKVMEQKIKKSILKEIKQNAVVTESAEDPFEKANQVLERDRWNRNNQEPQQEMKQYTKDPTLNQILNETAQSYNSNNVANGGDEEFRTMKMDSSNMGQVAGHAAQNGNIDRASMAAKMGYGDLSRGASMPQTTINNKPVNPNDPKTKSVQNAMNRDYSELVKKFKK